VQEHEKDVADLGGADALRRVGRFQGGDVMP
jgi:hypothetical protein